ncbi:Fanconi anemia group D2 protein homolog isoform X2 [Jatropha curcas]|uniref:Fanconi anemia group D2 protein homolog isoform X2 n=1 Tax=Jatropha curcas TaxID=180498 RepID=UPI0009D6D5E4|nr:Fanconi anemia group D2 protein homolog isoform X2 [Jatropha curcas]
MVFLHHQIPSRKRHSLSSASTLPPTKFPKSTADEPSSCSEKNGPIDKMLCVLADAGCTLNNPSGPPCLPANLYKLRSHLDRLFSASENGAATRSHFLAGFSSYIDSPKNLQRVLVSSNQYCSSESLLRQLLLVPAIQLDLQMLLLQKLPEYFDVHPECSLQDDSARLIVNQFRWLDFMVDSNAFCDKLMQVLSICPLHLKKEIIGSLPEIIGDQNTKAVVDSLGQMLQEDSSVIISVLDCFSNLNLDEILQEQVVTIAMSYIRTIDGEHMPYLLRFLLLSATSQNVRRIVSQIREQLKFIGISNSHSIQHKKLKGKSPLGNNTEASVLDALRTSLLFKNMLRQEILKELISLERPQDHKAIDLWLLVLLYMNGETMQKNIQKVVKKKVVDNCIQKVMVDQCICGNKELVQDCFLSFLSLSEYLLARREQKAREFGAHIYICLFEELGDTYCRQEVLSALITHLGSGVSFEVNSALEVLALLASKYAQELIPLTTHINGILDYLEGFSIDNLHKVYEIFSHLTLFARSTTECFGSSFGSEVLMIVRKQMQMKLVVHQFRSRCLVVLILQLRCRSPAPGFSRMTVAEFLSKIRPLFPYLRSHFDTAVSTLKEGDESCEEHWKVQSAFAGNPDIANMFPKSSVSILLCNEVLHCFSKMLNLPEVQMEKAVISDLLEAFQPSKISKCVFSTIQPSPLPGTIEYLYLGAASFLEDVLDTACSFSFTLASESLLTLESMVTSIQTFLDKLESNGKSIWSQSTHGVLQILRRRLGTSAQKLLKHSWNGENLENGWKNKGEVVEKILCIYLENSESKSDLLDELACNVLPQVSSSRRMAEDHGFQTLCNETFVVWYHVLHEVNLATLNHLVKDVILRKSRADDQLETVEKQLVEIQRSVNALVSLVNICRTHDKVNVHAMAIKYGGKFVDSFLKVFDFLQAHFQTHNELVIQLVKELQKATRTIQTICSEAKGLKQVASTSKIPSTKRSIECFLFRVKALLHTTSNGCTFWMGNLKHKDLMGQVVSSQAYVDEQAEPANVDGDLAEVEDSAQPASAAGEHEDGE